MCVNDHHKDSDTSSYKKDSEFAKSIAGSPYERAHKDGTEARGHIQKGKILNINPQIVNTEGTSERHQHKSAGA